VSHDAEVVEERAGASARAIDELIDQHHLARVHVFLQRADRRHAQDLLCAELLEREHVGAVVDAVRRDAVPAAVTRQEQQRRVAELAAHDRVRGRAEGRVDAHLPHVREPLELVEPAAADDAERPCHDRLPCRARRA
jgi:hypothetical protein